MPVIDDLRTLAPLQQYRAMGHDEQLWRASLLSRCMRLQILAAKGVNLPDSSSLTRKFDMRRAAHDQAQNWINECIGHKYEVRLEEKVYDPNTRCGGHIDAIIVDGDTASIVEVKTYAFLKGDIKEDSYWQDQISFYYHTVNESGKYLFVQPVIMIVTLDGQIRVVEPIVTEAHRDMLNDMNWAWDSDELPKYIACHTTACSKCPIQHICTEDIPTISEFTERVRSNYEQPIS